MNELLEIATTIIKELPMDALQWMGVLIVSPTLSLIALLFVKEFKAGKILLEMRKSFHDDLKGVKKALADHDSQNTKDFNVVEEKINNLAIEVAKLSVRKN